MASEARVVTGGNAEEIARWCEGVVVAQLDPFEQNNPMPGINVPVGDSVERATVGDMVIRKEDGTFEVFKG